MNMRGSHAPTSTDNTKPRMTLWSFGFATELVGVQIRAQCASTHPGSRNTTRGHPILSLRLGGRLALAERQHTRGIALLHGSIEGRSSFCCRWKSGYRRPEFEAELLIRKILRESILCYFHKIIARTARLDGIISEAIIHEESERIPSDKVCLATATSAPDRLRLQAPELKTKIGMFGLPLSLQLQFWLAIENIRPQGWQFFRFIAAIGTSSTSTAYPAPTTSASASVRWKNVLGASMQ
jgi:hypothetical protein